MLPGARLPEADEPMCYVYGVGRKTIDMAVAPEDLTTKKQFSRTTVATLEVTQNVQLCSPEALDALAEPWKPGHCTRSLNPGTAARPRVTGE